MTFPQKIKHRKAVVTIYGKTPSTPAYRVCWYEAGDRQSQQFKTYKDAKEEAERTVRRIAKGSSIRLLSPTQSRDALASIDSLDEHYRRTGIKLSLLTAVSSLLEASKKLGEHSIHEAVEGYLKTVAQVHRTPLSEAITEFRRSLKHQTEKYVRNVSNRLDRLSSFFRNTDVCDITKANIDLFFDHLEELKPKTRNHYRAAVLMFLRWSQQKDYLPANHRIAEADSLRKEPVLKGDVAYYTPEAYQQLLTHAPQEFLPCLLLGGLAGLRTEEISKIEWSHIWRREGLITLEYHVGKGRCKRLVTIQPSLSSLLAPFRSSEGKVFPKSEPLYHREFNSVCKAAGVERIPNGLRHAFITYHFALFEDEKATTREAGNSPHVMHTDYKGLATKSEAEDWFNVS